MLCTGLLTILLAILGLASGWEAPMMWTFVIIGLALCTNALLSRPSHAAGRG